MRILSAMIALALLAGTSDGQAATTKKPARTVPKPMSATERMLTAIAINAVKPGENLAAACSRAQPLALFGGLEPNLRLLNDEKGEFEATADFDARKAKLDGIMQSFGPIAVCKSLSDEDLSFTYNADTGKFTARATALQRFTAHTVSKKLAPYRAKTRMGISFTVYPWIELDWDFSVAGRFDDRCFTGLYGKLLEVPSPIERAPALKAKGRLVVIGNLTAPFYGSEDDDPTPSLDEPEVTSTRTMTVYLKAKRATVIDYTGTEVWACEAA